MTATEYRAICNELMRNHHKRLLNEAIIRDDADAIAHEKAILYQLQANLKC